jgi:hypothetical protein
MPMPALDRRTLSMNKMNKRSFRSPCCPDAYGVERAW